MTAGGRGRPPGGDGDPGGDWDVAIVGGGPAATAAALALRQAGDVRVCLVEPGPRAGLAVGESIPPDTRLELERLGAWDRFAADAHQPCLGSCSAWGSDALGYNDFLLSPHGPGWHLDRPRFNATLLDQAIAAGATRISGSLLAGRRRAAGDGCELRLRDRRDGATRVIGARFVIDATGPRAVFAAALGARRVTRDRLTVVCGFLDTGGAAAPSRLTLLEAERDGWWYAAALPGGRLIAAFATDAGAVRAAGLTQPEAWLARCRRTRHVASRLAGGRLRPAGLLTRTATSSILRPAAGPGWVAAGDAAATYDPICAQGIHKALADGSRAAAAALATVGGATRTAAADAAAYVAATEAAFGEYEAGRGYFYRLETRWAASSFWRRRAGAPGPD